MPEPITSVVATYQEPGRLVIEQRELPPLQAGEVVLAVEACGICGSDLHAYDAGWMAPGSVPGHETAGTIVEVAPDVEDFRVGDRIAIHPLIPCGQCSFCVAGRDNVCSRMRDARGGFSTHMVLPVGTRKFRLPEGMDSALGAMLEPLAVAVRAVDLAPLVGSDTPVVVPGLGPIGQCVVRVLRARGFTNVIAIDVIESKLHHARAAGAATLNARENDVAAELRTKFGGGQHKGYEYANVPLVIDCSGSDRVIAESVRSHLQPGGTLVVAALFERELTLDFNPLVRKEITVQGSYSANGAALADAYRLITSGRTGFGDLISKVIPLEQIDETFRSKALRADAVKLVIDPRSALLS